MAQYSTQRNELLENNNTLYEVVMLADPYGNTGAGGNSSTSQDAFGRQRVSEPFTLFDSFTRYGASRKIATKTNGTASTEVGSDSASINLIVDGTSGSSCYRETKRVFAYQPGKSLQILNSFVMAEGVTNLRQRVGYFTTTNGIFLELDGTELYLVKRSQGSDTRVAQDDWNVDRLDGTGRSNVSLDITKAQLFWMDIEWLGVGSIRCGFVVDGVFIHCHSFHHANTVTAPYMVTACLPIRYEIENTGTTSVTKKLKQICATVMSEGGYTVTGEPRSISIPLGSEKDLTAADTYYPVMAIRLKDSRRDAIVVPSGISLAGTTNGSSIVHYKVYTGATVSGGSWLSLDSSSNVTYNITPTGFSNGTIVNQGFFNLSNQSSSSIELRDGIFQYQLERNFDSCETFLLVAGTSNSGDDVIASINWKELT
jgi:hypothetical protein